MRILLLVFLAVCSFRDIKSKKVPALWLYASIVCMGIYAGYRIAVKERDVLDLVFALIPGVMAYLLGRMTKQVGEADGMLIFLIGLCLPAKELMEVVFLAFTLSAVGSVFYIIRKRRARGVTIAFVPFLFLGVLFLWVEAFW